MNKEPIANISSYCYIASPYSSPYPEIVKARYEITLRFTADLFKRTFYVYSPIVHCHKIAKIINVPTDFEFWRHYNTTMLSKASSFFVLTLEGWEYSKGVTEEIKIAISETIPIHYFDSLTFDMITKIS